MDSDDEEALRLNSLHRFRKHSPRLLLEEYSHCEVPAGCGGVVMRWVDPRMGTPALVRVFAVGEVTIFVDGRALDSNRVDLAAGPHVLALELPGPVSTGLPRPEPSSRAGSGPAGSPLLVTIVRALGRDDVQGEGAVVLLHSSTTNVAPWRVTDQRPPPEWTTLDFDARRWPLVDDGSVQLAALRDAPTWQIEGLQRHGARPLALPSGRAWVRVRFDVPELDTPEGA